MTFNFGLPLDGYTDYQDRKTEQEAKLGKYISSYLSLLQNYKFSSSSLSLICGGDFITAEEIQNSFFNDVVLASISLNFIFIFL